MYDYDQYTVSHFGNILMMPNAHVCRTAVRGIFRRLILAAVEFLRFGASVIAFGTIYNFSDSCFTFR